jgi:Nickel responsive protein SCO4226-like
MTSTIKRYVIERDIPNVGSLSRAQLKDLAATSNGAIAKLSGKVQWVHSYIAADGTFCIYLADSELSVREHSRLAGFPITKVTEAPTVIDPMTAFV